MKQPKFDLWLITPVILLLSLSILTLIATSPEEAQSQALFILVAAIAYLVVSKIDLVIFFSIHKIVYVVSIIFLILPFIFGLTSRGANRWLQFGQFSLQPSELIKPFLFITFAIIATTSGLRLRLPTLIGVFLIPWLIIFLQPDLGTSLVMGVGWLVIFLSRIDLKKTFLGAVFFALMIAPVYSFILLPYQRDRLQTFINPYSDPLGRGYHVIQSIIAVGSGGFYGRGLGHGTQSELQFLPENHTDFIFASISESFGFIGSFTVIVLYAVILGRIYKISQTVSQPEVSLWCLAIMGSLGFQIFINIGMNIGIAPVTGITLPFLSYGGSSLLSMGVILGLLNRAVAKPGTFLV